MDTRGGSGLRWSAFTGSGVLGGTTVTANVWTFVVVRYNQTTGQVILDVNGYEFTATGTQPTGQSTSTIGRIPNFDLPFDGTIDNVFFYYSFLSTPQIAAIFAAGRASIDVHPTSILTATGGFTQQAGTTTLSGGTLAVGSSQVTLSGGTLTGSGTIAGNLFNAAIVSPGAPIGTLLVTGAYTQTSAGVLNIDLGGATAGSAYDQLIVNGAVTLDGTLNVDEINGFAATNGESFQILISGSLTGDFATINGLVGPHELLVANYASTGVTLVSEEPGIEVSPTTGLQTSQAGATATFDVVLDTQPTGNVTIGLSSSNTSAGTISTSQLVFTPQNWNVPQVVTVTGVNDFMDDGNQVYTIVTAPAISTDPVYGGFDASDVTVTNLGTMHAGFNVTPTTGLQTSQAGATATYTVVLTSKPLTDVIIDLLSSLLTAGTVLPAMLTFTPLNWNLPQTITITGANDQKVDGNVPYTIINEPAVSGDSKYNQLDPPDVSVTNVDTNLLDLQVANLAVAPSSLQSGTAVTVSWNDTNTGNIATPAGFNDTITVTNQTTGQTLLNTQLFYDPTAAGNAPIQPGQEIARHIGFTLPDGSAGAGQLLVSVTTNSTNSIAEANAGGTASTNNNANITVTSALAPYPDLQVTGLQLNPSGILFAGQNMTVLWNDANTGNGPTPGSWTDTVLVKNLTTGQTLQTINVPYNAATAGAIAAGQSFAQQTGVTLPGGAAGAGNISVTVTVDAGNNIFEFNSAGTAETNNTANITATSTSNPEPDLTVTSLQLNSTAGLQSGQTVTVLWNDSNIGNAAASGSWQDTLVVTNTSTGQTLATVNVPFNSASSGSSPIAAGQSAPQQTTITLPDGTPGIGTLQFTVTVNSNNALIEDNAAHNAQSNNTASITAASTAAPYPDLQVTGLSLNPASGLHAGQTVTVQWSDANAGTGATTGSWTDTVLVQNLTTGQTLQTINVPYNAATAGALAAGQAFLQQTGVTLPTGVAGVGNISFTVTVDAVNNIFEFNSSGTAETNNTASIMAASASAPAPDLQVTSLSVTPATGLQSGQNLTLQWNDANTGNAGTGAASWIDALTITNLTTGATLLTTTISGGSSLAAGNSLAQKFPFTLPAGNGSVGQIQFTVTVDAGNSIGESNSAGTGETNNTASISETATLAPSADLQVGSISFSPLSGVLSGSTVTVNWNDMNTGNAPTPGPWSDRLVLVNTTTGQTVATATLYYDTVAKGPLAAGAFAARSYDVQLPDGAAGTGQIQATITTDFFNNIAEITANGAGETNNIGSAAFTSAAALYPDLQPTNLQVSSAAGLQSGGSLTVQWKDSNIGVGSAATAWTDTVVVVNTTTGATLASVNVPYDPTAAGNSPLAAGQALAQQVPITLPPGTPGAGNLQITITANATGALFEDNAAHNAQANNTASISAVSSLAPYPDLVASGVTFSPDSPIVGDPATVTFGWTVTNNGTAPTSAGSWVDNIIYSADDNPADGKVLGSFPHTGDLAANANYPQSQTFMMPPGFSGQYHLFVETDARDVVFENGSKANNYAEAGSLFDVTPTLYADLVVSSASAPTTAGSGLPMTVNWSVANQGIGTTNANEWSDTVSLATDPQGQHIVATLGSFSHAGALSPGGSYARSGVVTLPEGISGTYYAVVHTSGPYEFIYTNNNTAVSGPINVTSTPLPNLTVTSIVTANTAPSGSTIDVSWTVENVGGGDANSSWPDVVSLQEVGGAGRTIGLGGFTYTNGLAAGKSYTRTEQFTLPADFQGVFQAVVTTDPETLIGRLQFEVPNPVDTTVDFNTITITQPPHPDLQVESITPAASQFQAGGTLGLQFEVINQGTVATTTPHWNDNVYLSLDNTFSPDDILLASVGNQSALQPGQSYLSTVSDVVVPKSKGGPYYLIVDTNAGNAVDEFPNGNNNTLAVPITINPILPSDPVVSKVIVPSQAVAGSQVQVTYTVTNQGLGTTDLTSWSDGIWLVTDKTKFPYVTGTLLTSIVHNGALTNDPHDPNLPQSYTQTVTVTLPLFISGQYFLVPQTDLYQQLDATTLAQNLNPDDPNDLRNDNFKAAAVTILGNPPPDLVVTGIKAPASAEAGTQYPLSWTVTNQGAGTTVDSQWYDGVYLSNKPTYNASNPPGQISLGFFLHTGALSPGQSYTAQQTILLSPAYSGDYVIIYTNQLGPGGGSVGTWEGPYTTNNTAAVPTNVLTAPADLQVTSVVTQPVSYSGESTAVTWTVTNLGSPVWSGSQFWYDLIWFSPYSSFSLGTPTFLGYSTHTSAQPLGTNQSYTTTQDVTLPAGIGAKLAPITYYIYVATDPLPPNPLGAQTVPVSPRAFSTINRTCMRGKAANETNNMSLVPLPVYYREPDLFVNNLVVPTTPPQAGDTISVTYTVINQGTRDTRATSWTDVVYLSTDPSLDPRNAIVLGKFSRSGALAIGASYTATLNVTLPYGISGNFYILVFTDDDTVNGIFSPMGRVPEFQDEGNNITAVPMQVLPTPLPDLQVTALTVPQQATENQTLSVSYTVSNESSAPTLPGQTKWVDLIYLSVDQYLDLNSDIYLGEENHVGALAGNASYSISDIFQLPRGLSGPFYVFVITDPIQSPASLPRGKVYEENENNNSLASTFQVIINPQLPADLVVSNIQVPPNGQTGQPVTVSWTVTNQGQFPASGAWTDAVYLASTPIWNINDPIVGEVSHSSAGLTTGQSYTSTLTAMLPPAIPGNYYLIVRTNLFGDVYEGTTGVANDITASANQMLVKVPALQLGVPLTATLTKGQNQLYQVTVPEHQTLQVSLTSTDANAANEIYLRYNAVPTAFQYDAIYSGPLQANQTAVIPGTQAGTYYVLVTGADNPVSLLAQLLPLEITNVSPDEGGDSAYVTTIISGAQFDSKAIVKLVMPGFAEFEPVSYQVVNSSEIIAVFDLTDAPHGLYDVSVINPDGAEADAPYRYLIEPALPPTVTIGLGGTSIMYSGDTGYYGLSLQSTTDVDIPYVQFEFGVPNLGFNLTVGAPYVTLSSNVSGSPNVSGVPWADLSPTVDTNGSNLASGYVMDLADDGFVGLNFTAKTYEGVPPPNFTDIFPPETVGFTFNVDAAATSLTTAQYIAEQTQEAEFLRQSILADPTATPALVILAQNATSWDNLYLSALEQAGLLRPVDMPPAAQQDPNVTSLSATLAAGILAGSAGDQIITNGNLSAFFAQVQKWYGSDPTLMEPGVPANSIPMTALLPTPSQFSLDGANPSVFEAFNVYVRQISVDPSGFVEVYFPDLNGNTQAQPADINQYLASDGTVGQNATLVGPTGYGPQQFLPEGQNLPYTVQFQNAANASTPVEQVRITQQLDPNLDPRTFRLGDLQLGDLSVQIPAGLATFQGDFDFTQTKGFILRVSAGMDLDTNTATWLLQAIDPNTGEVLQSATEGLLMPGETGFAGYTIKPLAGLATGIQISANATVLFNNAPPLDTNTLTQTIDGTAPTTTLTATPLMAGSSNYQVSWNSQDDANGSGLKSVTVYALEDGGDYKIWLDQTQLTSAVFQGQSGHTYKFLALGTDNAGNVEQPPSGVATPSDGSQVNLGAVPTVSQTPTNVPPAPTTPPTTTPTPSPLFTQGAGAGIPSP